MSDSRTSRAVWPEAPYKGLGFYTEKDALLFAGRRTDIQMCASMLADSRTRILLLHGLTGCGKTSFLRAGLTPHFETTRAGIGFARSEVDKISQTLFVRSTAEPLAALAHELHRFASNVIEVETPDGPKTIRLRTALPDGDIDAAAFLRDVEKNPDTLLDVLERLSRPLSETLILIIDQAEEVLTLDGTAEGVGWRDRFFEFLAEFARSEFDLKLLIALRTEYLGRFLARARRHFRQSGIVEFFLDDLNESQIREAILRPTSTDPRDGIPFEQYRFSFDDEVVDAIVSQVGRASGGKLTALQIVCMALYDRMNTSDPRRITVETLESIGGVEGSIERFLDATLFECGRQLNLPPLTCDEETTRWKGVLHGLARPQPDGTVTTDIKPASTIEQELTDSRLPFDTTVKQLVSRLLLRPVNVVDVANGSVIPCFGLGHDTLGLVLRNWKTRQDRRVTPVRSAPDDVDEEPPQMDKDMALCLSGSGYRAMLFNLGAIWRLNELAMLPQLARLSCVSAGAIVGAFLGYRWKHLTFVDGVATNFESVVVAGLRELAGRTIDQASLVMGLLLPGKSPGDKFAERLDQHLFQGSTLQDFPHEPVIMITATNLQCASLFRFSRSYLADYRVGRVSNPVVPLATAVAASGAIPPILSPVILSFSDNMWQQTLGMEPDPSYRREVHLTNGSIYDHLGLEGAWKKHRTILISDGGIVTGSTPSPPTDWIRQFGRLFDVMDSSVRALRRRQVIDAFASGQRQGAYWTIRNSNVDLDASLNVDPSRVLELAQVPTRLRELSEDMQERLINWGYAACDAPVRKYLRGSQSTSVPARFPYPIGV